MTVNEFKDMLGRSGLLPLTLTLEASLDQLDSATMTKGGLCELLALSLRLAGKCESQKEIIDQVTEQLVAGETQQEQGDAVMEEMIQQQALELQNVKVGNPPFSSGKSGSIVPA